MTVVDSRIVAYRFLGSIFGRVANEVDKCQHKYFPCKEGVLSFELLRKCLHNAWVCFMRLALHGV